VQRKQLPSGGGEQQRRISTAGLAGITPVEIKPTLSQDRASKDKHGQESRNYMQRITSQLTPREACLRVREDAVCHVV